MNSIVQNVYVSPSLQYLRDGLADLQGVVEVSQLELQTGLTDERAFVALLSARLCSTLGDMVALMRAPTFPVHDEPMGSA